MENRNEILLNIKTEIKAEIDADDFQALINSKEIDSVAKLVREQYFSQENDLSENNLNLESALQYFEDLKVGYFSKSDLSSFEKLSDINGFIRYNDEANWSELFVRQDMSSERRNFALAHEFAHVVLNYEWTPKTGVTKNTDRIFTSTPKDPNATSNYFERQANEFAAEFLVPSEKLIETVKRLLKESKDSNKFWNSLTEKFGVSKTVLRRRLKVLRERGNLEELA